METQVKKKAHFLMAQKRMEQIRDFYMHLVIYCTVNILFFIFWLFDPGMPKTFWKPAFIMMVVVAGFAVLAHGLLVFGPKYLLSKDWEEREMKKLMDKEQKKSKYE